MKKLMKKLILTLIFCLVCSIASAGMMENLAAVAKKKVAPGGITYLIDEDFEGTGTPSGWATSGTITFDYDNGGDTSLQINSNYALATTPDFSTGTNTTIHFYFTLTLPTLAANTLVHIYNTSNVEQLQILWSGAAGNVLDFRPHGGAVGCNTAITTSKQYVWVDLPIGDGTMEIFVSTSATKPGTASDSVSVTNILAPTYMTFTRTSTAAPVFGGLQVWAD